jgi:AcrR family transcriptional regulator
MTPTKKAPQKAPKSAASTTTKPTSMKAASTTKTKAKAATKTEARASSAELRARAKVPGERPGRPGGLRDTNRKERTKALTDAALALFLERGIEAVTIEDITQKAGVAKGSFYRYFDDKAALVENIFSPMYAAVTAAFDASLAAVDAAQEPPAVAASYQVLAGGLFELVLFHADAALLYLQENRGPGHGARAPVIQLADLIVEKAVAHTTAVRAHGLLKPFPAEVSTLTVIGAVERLLWAMLSGRLKTNLLEVPGLLISLVLDGVRNRDVPFDLDGPASPAASTSSTAS